MDASGTRLMHFFGEVIAWFGDPSHWHGVDGVPNRVFEHLELSIFVIVCAVVIAVPLGIVLGHTRRGGFAAISVVNIGRAIPSFAIVAVALPIAIRFGLGFGFWPTWLAVFVLALPVMFTQSYVAVANVDPEVVSAARGMGLRETELLRQVELPLAAPLIAAGIRVAAVQVVATAPLGAVVGWGGLGRFIIDGLAQFNIPEVFAGALLVAVIAVLTDVAFAGAERAILPAGVRRLARDAVATRVANVA